MATSREQIMTALLARLITAGEFKTVARRLRDSNSLQATATPALFLVEHHETYKRPTTTLQPIRELFVQAIIYFQAPTQQTVPASEINPLLDGLDVALAPDDRIRGTCTLGGLVNSVTIDGEIIKAPGDVSGLGLAIVPIRILIP